jgi:flagellar motor switch protein FliG
VRNELAERMEAPPFGVTQPALTSRQKAAVIVRLLLAEGAPVPVSALPEHLQAALTEQIGVMRTVDRETLRSTVEEFLEELERIGLSFPGGINGALDMLDGHISASAASRLRRLRGVADRSDPWERIAALPVERLMPVLEEESPEVAAVMLSKLQVATAAELLGRLPGEQARRVAYAVSLTSRIDPDTVLRIGQSLAAGLDAMPERAFEADPVERVGAILNVSAAATRDDVLQGLDQTDAEFASRVRKAIFTFAHIPVRLEGRDVPKLLRVVPQQTLVQAFIGAEGDEEASAAMQFLLENISQRMATNIREEMEAFGKVKQKEAEEAQAAIVVAIREMETAGEITLVQPEEE